MGLFAKIKAWFSPLIAKFRDFLKAIFQGAVEQALAALKDIAIQVVTEIQNDPKLITDEDKRKEAFKRIKEYSKGRGIQAGNSLVNLLIELSVAYLKNKS